MLFKIFLLPLIFETSEKIRQTKSLFYKRVCSIRVTFVYFLQLKSQQKYLK